MQNNLHHRARSDKRQFLNMTHSKGPVSPVPTGVGDFAQAGYYASQPTWQIPSLFSEPGNNAPVVIPSMMAGTHPMPPVIPMLPPYGWATPHAPILSTEAQAAFAPSMAQKKRPHTRFMVVGVGVAILFLLGSILSVLWFMTKTNGGVTLYQVNEQNVTQYVGGGGIVYPQQQFDLSYALPERVISVFIKAGDKVTKNEPLLQLDPAQLNAEITQAANNMAAAQAYLNSVSTNGNPITIAQAQQAYNQAKDRYSALVAQYSSPLIHNGTLISPMDGIITAININAGEVFKADTPLLTIMDESSVIVRVEIPLSYLGKVFQGQTAVVTPSALPNLSFNGTVSSIIPQADPQTDTFEVWVEVPNSQDSLLPGMSAFVRIQQKLAAFVVPRLAVLNPDREAIVFIVRKQHAYIQHVVAIGRSLYDIFVIAGLQIHDLVVLVGSYGLQDGQAINVLKVETLSS
jgi:RND family efflux transporter MFP subunit